MEESPEIRREEQPNDPVYEPPAVVDLGSVVVDGATDTGGSTLDLAG